MSHGHHHVPDLSTTATTSAFDSAPAPSMPSHDHLTGSFQAHDHYQTGSLGYHHTMDNGGSVDVGVMGHHVNGGGGWRMDGGGVSVSVPLNW